MNNILLIHGLNGSGDHSSTGKTLRRIFGSRLHTPNLPDNPARWYNFLEIYFRKNFAGRQVTLVGNSTGGLLAAYIAKERGWPFVLINPVVEAAELSRFVGLNRKFASGVEWYLSKEDVDSLKSYDITEPYGKALVFLGKNDEVLDYRKALALYGESCQVVVNDNPHQYRLSDSDLLLFREFCQ